MASLFIRLRLGSHTLGVILQLPLPCDPTLPHIAHHVSPVDILTSTCRAYGFFGSAFRRSSVVSITRRTIPCSSVPARRMTPNKLTGANTGGPSWLFGGRFGMNNRKAGRRHGMERGKQMSREMATIPALAPRIDGHAESIGKANIDRYPVRYPLSLK